MAFLNALEIAGLLALMIFVGKEIDSRKLTDKTGNLF